MNNSPTAAMLIIGNEILSGRTGDENLRFVASRLSEIGIPMMECRCVRDTKEEIAKHLNELRELYDYVFTSGGIGPTHDDITTESVAAAFGVKVTRHQETARLITEYYQGRGEEINDARLKMATIPEGANLIANRISAAPGFRMENVFVLAGVPKILQAMFDVVVTHLTPSSPILSRTVIALCGEGIIAEPLGKLQDANPDVEIGSYPNRDERGFYTSLVMRGVNPEALNSSLVMLCEKLTELNIQYEEIDLAKQSA